MSRYAGTWVGLKCVKDNIESTATVDGGIDRIQVQFPSDDEFQMPPDGLNVRLGDQPPRIKKLVCTTTRLMPFAPSPAQTKSTRSVTSGGANAKVGIISTGKSYLDVRGAMDLLNIDEVRANELGLRLYKVGMPWPLEPEGIKDFAKGLDLIIVVEEKALVDRSPAQGNPLRIWRIGRRFVGKRDEHRSMAVPSQGRTWRRQRSRSAVGERLIQAELGGEGIKHLVSDLKRLRGNKPVTPEAFIRTPYFCAGCPHNSSTKVPDGSHAFAGIGCHYMAVLDGPLDRGLHAHGGGGRQLGRREFPFSTRDHVFQNLGDGTYIHSGSLAIRSAVAANTNVTYKVLYNDAVAMTGGQSLDGWPNTLRASRHSSSLKASSGSTSLLTNRKSMASIHGLSSGRQNPPSP